MYTLARSAFPLWFFESGNNAFENTFCHVIQHIFIMVEVLQAVVVGDFQQHCAVLLIPPTKIRLKWRSVQPNTCAGISLVWVGYGNQFAKNNPAKGIECKQFTSYLLPFLKNNKTLLGLLGAMGLQAGWLAHGSYSKNTIHF